MLSSDFKTTFFFISIFFSLTILSHWDFSHGDFGLLSPEKASRDSRATYRTVPTGCFSVSVTHPNSDMDYGIFNVRTDENLCDCTLGSMDTVRECALTGRQNPLLHHRIEPASSACQSNTTHIEFFFFLILEPIFQLNGCETVLMSGIHINCALKMCTKRSRSLIINQNYKYKPEKACTPDGSPIKT